jgi:protein-L-isoaspartate(D-aspartate) O-methyltransferase
MDSTVQRKNMVDSQVRPSDVTDRRIARAMLDVPREMFAPRSQRPIAYMDGHLRVTDDGERPTRVLLAPRTLGKMIQHLDLEADATVLDVACATGYSTAVLAHVVRKVVGLECNAELAEGAREALAKLGLENAAVHVGALGDGVADRGPFDAILVNGMVAEVPGSLLNQLKDGGRLIAILDINGMGKVFEWRRFAMNFDRRALFDAEAPALPGFERTAEFVL